MMPSDSSDDFRALPRRDWGEAKCSNPWCVAKVSVRGEPCKACWEAQERYRKAMKAHKAARQSA